METRGSKALRLKEAYRDTFGWITVYPPPLEKQILDLLPLLLWVSGTILIVDASRRLPLTLHTSAEDSVASEAEHPAGQFW